MANTRFNVTCPSCDGDVPVTSTKTVGTKIECPKCKYRFTCPPNPSGEGAADAETPAATDTPKKMKKGGSTVLIGAVLGVLGVAVLVGGAIFVLGDEEPPKPQARVNPVVPPTPPPTEPSPDPVKPPTDPADPAPPVGPDKEPKDPPPVEPKEPPPADPQPPAPKPKDPAPKPSVPAKAPDLPRNVEVKRPPRTTPLPEVTNLLPGDTTAVYHVNMAAAAKTALYPAFFDPTIRELFQESFFFRSDLISVYQHAVVGPDREPFVVIRTDGPVDAKLMLDLWGPNLDIPKSSPVRGRGGNNQYFYLLKSNPFLKAVAGAFTPDSVLGQLGIRLPAAAKKPDANQPMAFHAYDDQTLILTTEAVMVKFLGDLQANGYPPFKTDVAALPPPPPAPPKDGATPGTPPPPPPPPPAATPPGTAPKTLFTTIRNFQTIEPDLKRTLNGLEPPVGAEPAAVLYAELLNQRVLAERGVGFMIGREVPQAAGLIESVRILGLSLTAFGKEKLVDTVTLEFTTDEEAKTQTHQRLLPSLYPLTVAVGTVLDTPIYLYNEVTAPLPVTPDPAAGFRPPTPQTATVPLTPYPVGVMPMGGALPVAPVDPTIPPGPDGTIPPPAVPKVSVITVSASDRVVSVATSIGWNQDKYTTKLTPAFNRVASQLRGKMVVFAGLTDMQNLSASAAKLVSRKQPFPRGALERDAIHDRFLLPYPPEQRTSFLADLLPYIGRGGLRAQVQDRKFAWYAKENLPAAESWVPEFLIPTYPSSSWRTTHPLVPDGRPVGGTNFVGLAGVGLDAARYNPANPEQAKKVGITGYDWGSAAIDVKDGLSNTAYLIQAQPGVARPWIAGGGATLTGVEDSNDALKPFLYAGPIGQRGAHVLMADGSVRFLKEGTNPAVFKAMVTRAGGENASDIDRVAPKVQPGRGVELRGGAIGAGPVPPADAAPAPRAAVAGKGG